MTHTQHFMDKLWHQSESHKSAAAIRCLIVKALTHRPYSANFVFQDSPSVQSIYVRNILSLCVQLQSKLKNLMKAEFKAALLDRIRWFSFSYSLLIETHLSSFLQKKRKSLLENLGSAIKHLKCCKRRVWASLTLIRRCFNTMLWSVAHSGSSVSAQRWIQTSDRKHTNTELYFNPSN